MSSSSLNYLTKPYADTLYCPIGGDCTLNNLIVINMSVSNINATNASQYCLNSECISEWSEVNQSESLHLTQDNWFGDEWITWINPNFIFNETNLNETIDNKIELYNSTLETINATYKDSNVFWAERGAIVAGAAWAWGNGRPPQGSVVGYNNTHIVKMGLECLTVGTLVEAGVRVNGAVTSCNVTVTASSTANVSDCDLYFNETDILGIYAEREINTATDCVGTVWVEREKTLNITGLKGEKGDKGDSGTEIEPEFIPQLNISECSKDSDSMTWRVQLYDYEWSILQKNAVVKCWASETANYTATDDMVCSVNGNGLLLYSDSSGSKYYGSFLTENNGDVDVDCLGSASGGADCWLMCELDGIVYSSRACDTCPSGVPI